MKTTHYVFNGLLPGAVCKVTGAWEKNKSTNLYGAAKVLKEVNPGDTRPELGKKFSQFLRS